MGVSAMFKTTSRLSGLMPYGAPELLESARPLLARAVLLGSALWTAVFLMLLATGMLRVAQAPPVAFLTNGDDKHVIQSVLEREPRGPSTHAVAKPPSTHAAVVPVRSDVVEAKVD